MTRQSELPCLFMRAGTSRGPFFLADDLPRDRAIRDAVLTAALGSAPDGRQLDGLGGGDSLTSKVAIVGRSSRPHVDVDYTFAQVATDGSYVDATPSCGNMLAGVGPFAIETGLVPAQDGETIVRIHDVNTGSIVEAVVQTPERWVSYAGDAKIDGVAGTAAPIALNFMNIVGSKTGAMFPTGQPTEIIEQIPVSCIDVATPMVLIRAADLGLSGYEEPDELDAMANALAKVERIRRAAGWRMGLGDVAKSVLPKVSLVAAPKSGGAISSRYLTPWKAHTAHAVTGAICIAAACVTPDTIAARLCNCSNKNLIDVEHPAGRIQLVLEAAKSGFQAGIVKVGVIRTARLLMRGSVAVPLDACRSSPNLIAA